MTLPDARSGFTLVELLVALFAMALLAAHELARPRRHDARAGSRREARADAVLTLQSRPVAMDRRPRRADRSCRRPRAIDWNGRVLRLTRRSTAAVSRRRAGGRLDPARRDGTGTWLRWQSPPADHARRTDSRPGSRPTPGRRTPATTSAGSEVAITPLRGLADLLLPRRRLDQSAVQRRDSDGRRHARPPPAPARPARGTPCPTACGWCCTCRRARPSAARSRATGCGPPCAEARGHEARQAQRGAALLAAMLTVTLVATFAAAALWQQWRSVEVEAAERTRVQSAWVLIGALDWSRLILREDARRRRRPPGRALGRAAAGGAPVQLPGGRPNNTATDTGAEVLERLPVGPDHRPAVAAERDQPGGCDGRPRTTDCDSFRAAVRAARPAAGAARHAWPRTCASPPDISATTARRRRPLLPQRVEQLVWLGLPPQTVAALQPYVTILPDRTTVNLNTASAEVIYAVQPQASAWPTRSGWCRARERTPFRQRRPQAAAWLAAAPDVLPPAGGVSSIQLLRGPRPAAPGPAGGRGAVAGRARRHWARTVQRARSANAGRRSHGAGPGRGQALRRAPSYNAQHSMSSLIVLLPAQPASAATEFEYAADAGRPHASSRTAAPQARAAARCRRGAGAEVVAVVPAADAVLAPGRPAQGHVGRLARACAPCSRACWKTSCSTNRTRCTSRCSPSPRRGSRSGWRPAIAPGCAAPCRRWKPRERPAARIVPEFAPEGDTTLYAHRRAAQTRRWSAHEQRRRDDPAAVRAGAGAAAGTARGHAAAWPSPPWRRWPNRCCSTARDLQQAPQRWLQAAAVRLGPGAVRLRQLGPRAGLQETRQRLGRRAARRRSGGRRAGARCCWWLVNLVGLNAWAWKERVGAG